MTGTSADNSTANYTQTTPYSPTLTPNTENTALPTEQNTTGLSTRVGGDVSTVGQFSFSPGNTTATTVNTTQATTDQFSVTPNVSTTPSTIVTGGATMVQESTTGVSTINHTGSASTAGPYVTTVSGVSTNTTIGPTMTATDNGTLQGKSNFICETFGLWDCSVLESLHYYFTSQYA